MNITRGFWPLALALLVALEVSYLLCIGGDLLFGWTMYQAWMPLLPGFTWPLTAGGLLSGLIWLAGYSLYVPAIFLIPFNYLLQRADIGR